MLAHVNKPGPMMAHVSPCGPICANMSTCGPLVPCESLWQNVSSSEPKWASLKTCQALLNHHVHVIPWRCIWTQLCQCEPMWPHVGLHQHMSAHEGLLRIQLCLCEGLKAHFSPCVPTTWTKYGPMLAYLICYKMQITIVKLIDNTWH